MCSSRIAGLFGLLLLLFPLRSQTDSLPVYDLAGLTVSASATSLPINAPVARIDRATIGRFDNGSLLAGFNTIPGARFEERSPGSYRVSIRGSALRAPFGVRNVKVYWNGLPLTEPGGDTYLNFLDPLNVGSLTVFKGPAGSLYGSGTGGALLLASESQEESANYDQLGVQAGSFGSGRLEWEHRREKTSGDFYRARFAHQRTDGYRRHSQLARTTGELALHRKGNRGGGSSYHVLATDLHYEIPGGLNPEQFADNPQQARPGSEDSRAAINYRNLLVGGRFYGPLLKGAVKHESGIYASANRFDHPFNIDHKRERNLGVGGRSVLSHERSISGLGDLRVDAGLEFQIADKAARNYAPNAGEPGELNFIDDIVSYQSLVFAQASLEKDNGWLFTAGLSLEKLDYLVDRSFNAEGARENIESDFARVAAPRLSVAKKWGDGRRTYSVFAAYGLAYSPPTLSEFRTNEGSVNVDLRPERGHNYEVGLRRRSLGGFNLDLNVYYQRRSESIATFQDEREVQLFRNAGGSDQYGVEAAIERELLSPLSSANRFFNSLHFRLAYTLMEGEYRDYQVGDRDFSGNDIPGLTPRVLDFQLTLRTRPGTYLNLGLHRSATTTLNDDNDVEGPAYTLLRLRLGHRFLVNDWPAEIYLGGNNLMDERYSLGYDLNPRFGRRYFQPAPGVNFYLGARLQISK